MKDGCQWKNICCIGAGYVGGPTCAVIADMCQNINVTVVDNSEKKIAAWLSDDLPIYEPGLMEIVKRCLHRNLFFSTDVEAAVRMADLIFICVDTPTKRFGIGRGKAVDLSNLENVARLIARVAQGQSKVVVEKSTVPVKAAESIKQILSASGNCCSGVQPKDAVSHHVVLSNPEFLAEGSAVRDLKQPDRVLIGVDDRCELGQRALQGMRSLYGRWVAPDRILVMSTWSSELSKLAANAVLAQRVSSINSLSAVCEASGADIREVSHAIGSDSRIGPHFLQAGVGFGGSCFRKDVLNLVYLSESLQLPEVASYWQAVIDLNEYQKRRITTRVLRGLLDTIKNKKIAIWGFAFKKNTKDSRDSPAIDICKHLLEESAFLSIYDPKVLPEQIMTDLEIPDCGSSKVKIASSPRESTDKADAIVLCTDWDEFMTLDFHEIYHLMNHPALIFDGRLILDHKLLRSIGFKVEAIGISTRTDAKQSTRCSCIPDGAIF